MASLRHHWSALTLWMLVETMPHWTPDYHGQDWELPVCSCLWVVSSCDRFHHVQNDFYLTSDEAVARGWELGCELLVQNLNGKKLG